MDLNKYVKAFYRNWGFNEEFKEWIRKAPEILYSTAKQQGAQPFFHFEFQNHCIRVAATYALMALNRTNKLKDRVDALEKQLKEIEKHVTKKN
jgi:hypothetical protein